MAEFIALEVERETDLSELSRFLWQQGVGHRVISRENRQWLLVANQQDAQQVQQAYQQFLRGEELQLAAVISKPKAPWSQSFQRLPITLITIVLSLLGYFSVMFISEFPFASYLSFYAIVIEGQSIKLQLAPGQYWRLITPIFLHFTLMHIVFNMLWFWDLGRRVEIVQGSMRLFGLIVVIGLGSNIAQVMFSEISIFGGMSGVIYGLLGYLWLWGRMRPIQAFQLPTAIVIFMLAWLLLCMTGFTELIGQGAVANAAHLGGLIMGLVIAYGSILLEKPASQS